MLKYNMNVKFKVKWECYFRYYSYQSSFVLQISHFLFVEVYRLLQQKHHSQQATYFSDIIIQRWVVRTFFNFNSLTLFAIRR